MAPSDPKDTRQTATARGGGPYRDRLRGLERMFGGRASEKWEARQAGAVGERREAKATDYRFSTVSIFGNAKRNGKGGSLVSNQPEVVSGRRWLVRSFVSGEFCRRRRRRPLTTTPATRRTNQRLTTPTRKRPNPTLHPLSRKRTIDQTMFTRLHQRIHQGGQKKTSSERYSLGGHRP